jgi:RNA polymerase-binding transcription factor DksA
MKLLPFHLDTDQGFRIGEEWTDVAACFSKSALGFPGRAEKGATPMKGHKRTGYSDRLSRRREEIDLTLRHLENERRQVEANTEWRSRDAYHSRIKLLQRLTGWYRDEIHQVEAAIQRARTAGYGRCVACHKSIEPKRLAGSPETELCADCETSHERSQ